MLSHIPAVSILALEGSSTDLGLAIRPPSCMCATGILLIYMCPTAAYASLSLGFDSFP